MVQMHAELVDGQRLVQPTRAGMGTAAVADEPADAPVPGGFHR